MNPVPNPFDGLAKTYDEDFTRTNLGRRLRCAVWTHFDRVFQPDMRLLELGCGTGEDATHLAARGVRVLATDASEAMVDATRRKSSVAGVSSLVDARRLAFEDLPGALPSLGTFDGAFSNFGALNCANSLSSTARALGSLLNPGAPLILVVMGRFVPWEWVWFLMRGQPARALRRVRKEGVHWRGLTVSYPSPRELETAFSPGFRRTGLIALGALLPPSYAETSVNPETLEVLDRLERRSEAFPLLAWLSDHYLIQLERL